MAAAFLFLAMCLIVLIHFIIIGYHFHLQIYKRLQK